jgi:multidrug efflux pump subunit AcrA (membrane-fusion protein)
MKKKIIALAHKPKTVIPASILIALVIGAMFYNSVGRAPTVDFPANAGATNVAATTKGTIGLSFLKTGRLATLAVKSGDTVKKGDVLATLDAADALGALNQAKGALELAKAQYASLNVQYASAKTQQDVLVANAYRTLLSSGLAALAEDRTNSSIRTVDADQLPEVGGTYTCSQSGTYDIYPYASGAASGYSFEFKGLEQGTGVVAFYTPQSFGACGLTLLFPVGYRFDPSVKWIIAIPNARSASYAANKNSYDLAVATRDQVLKQLEANLGQDGSTDANVAQAAVDAAEGSYEVALAAYNNTRIIAPADGTVSFVDSNLNVGETIAANKVVITLTR